MQIRKIADIEIKQIHPIITKSPSPALVSRTGKMCKGNVMRSASPTMHQKANHSISKAKNAISLFFCIRMTSTQHMADIPIASSIKTSKQHITVQLKTKAETTNALATCKATFCKKPSPKADKITFFTYGYTSSSHKS